MGLIYYGFDMLWVDDRVSKSNTSNVKGDFNERMCMRVCEGV